MVIVHSNHSDHILETAQYSVTALIHCVDGRRLDLSERTGCGL
jgi:hypothetical protein